ncbi:MAG: hypothetical protein ACJ8FS_15195 [Sphingomicrobium sp.]
MHLPRPIFAPHPGRFGRGPVRGQSAAARASTLGADLKLFASTFAAGFLFVSILIG